MAREDVTGYGTRYPDTRRLRALIDAAAIDFDGLSTACATDLPAAWRRTNLTDNDEMHP